VRGDLEAVAEAAMFGERRGRGERLLAVRTADALATVGVHSLVTTQIRELRVRLVADVAAERLDAAVDVLVLFEAARRRERLAAAGTLMLTHTGSDSVHLRATHLPLSDSVLLAALTAAEMLSLIAAADAAFLRTCVYNRYKCGP